MAPTSTDLAALCRRVVGTVRSAGRGQASVRGEIRALVEESAPDSYDRGVAEALLLVLTHGLGTDEEEPQRGPPFEPGSLPSRLLLEVAAGVHGANADLAERLGTDDSQVSRAGRRLRQLGLAVRTREGRLNRWSITPDGQALVDSMRSG